MSNTLVGNVDISPPNPRPAESFRVEVMDENGISYSGQPGVAVYIDGVPGAVQYLQARREGKRPFLVRVKKGDESQILEKEITVSGNPLTFRNNKGNREPAMLSVDQVLSSPYEVSFILGDPPSRSGELRAKNFRHMRVANVLDQLLGGDKGSRPTLARAIIGSDRAQSVTTRKSTINREKFVTRRAEVTTGIINLGDVDLDGLLGNRGGNNASFEWDFGDGTKKTTVSPHVNYDYSQALTADDEVLHFDVRCRSVRDNIEVTRTLVLHSAYVMCKQRGTIVPPVKADIYAHKAIGSFHGVLEVTNLDPVPLTITAQAIVPLTDNPNSLETPVFRNLKDPITLPPLSTTVLGVYPRYQSSNAGLVASLNALGHNLSSAVSPVAISGDDSVISRRSAAIPGVAIKGAGIVKKPSFSGDVPKDAPGFTVYFAGRNPEDMPVRFTHVFEIHMDERNSEPEWPELEVPQLGRRPWPWEEVMSTIDEVLNQRKKVADQLNVAVETDSGIIAVSANKQTLQGKNTALKAAAREICQAGLAPMRKMARQFLITTPRRTTATPEDCGQSGVKSQAQSLKIGADSERKSYPAAQLTPKTSVLADLPERARTVEPTIMKKFSIGSGAEFYFTKQGPPPPGPVAEGEVCHPDNISAMDQTLADAQQLVCQLSDEKDEYLMPARFMNGRKGDIILSPGGPGLVGSLLRAVDPPQKYSHSGIMTRNYDEVTHSTASEDRIYDYLVGTLSEGTDGIRPDILKWMWPGVVAQKVEAAIYGENWTDPESGKQYSISSFSAHAVGVTHNDNFQIVPPLIVKPDPMLETNQVRQTLHTVCASARADSAMIDGNGTLIQSIKSHYRFFCYTNPEIGLTDVAPSASGWAMGTYPSVCSSFIWMALKKNNIRLEGDSSIVHPTDLEPVDVEVDPNRPYGSGGAGVLPTTKDGLYWYTAAERLVAGKWLYKKMHDKAYEEAGWFGDLLTDAADDVGNQLVNTFALDDAEGKDHDDWKQMQDANAVSPDNIMFWDGPNQGGLYGYPEPLIYREPRVEMYTVSRWKRVLSRGTITGTVRRDGQLVQGVLVELYDGMSDFTDGNGVYSMSDVPFGPYMMTASKIIGGVYYSAKVNVQLNQEVLSLDVDLEPPADRYRLAQLYIDFYGREDEDWPWDDETTNPGPEYYELELGPDKTTHSKPREYKWGGEARVEYDITVLLLVDNSIQVNVNAVLYEGTSESTNDLDGTASISFNVPKDQTTAGYIKVVNTDENEEDTYGELTLSVKNAQNNN